MKYEIVHDIIANQVFRKASEATRRRAQAKKYVEGRFEFFNDDRTDNNSEPTAGLLSIEELRKIDVYKEEISFKPEVLEFIEASRKALATAAEIENERLNAALAQEKVNMARELSIAEHRDKAKEQLILRTRIGISVASILILLLFFGMFYAQTSYWKAKASEAVAEAVSAFHIEDDITIMYQKAAEALGFSPILPEAQEQFYQSIYDADRQNRLYYTDINTDIEINTIENQEDDTQAHNVVSQTEQYIAILSDTTTVTLYDINKPKAESIVFDLILPKKERIFTIAFSADDKYLLIGSTNIVYQYEISSKSLKKHYLNGLKYIKGDKNFFFAVTNIGLIQKIDLNTAKKQTLPLPAALADNKFSDASMSSDNKNLILRSDDMGFNTLFALQLLGETIHTQAIFENVLAHSFNDSILTVQQEASIQLYNLNHFINDKPYFTKEIAAEEIRHIKICPDFLVVSHTATDELFGINSTSISPIGSIDKSMMDNDDDLNYNAQADKDFLLLSHHKAAFLYPKNTTINLLSQYRMIGHKEPIVFQQVLHKSQKVLTISNDGQIKTWQISSPCVVELNLKGSKQPIVHTDFSLSDKYVLTVADSTHQVALWRTDSLAKPYILAARPSLPFACFSPDNRYLIMPFGKIMSYYKISDFQANKTPIPANIALNADIKWCKRSENGANILALTHTNCLISINANNSNSELDTLALFFAANSPKPKRLYTKKAIAFLNTRIDSASTSLDGRYIIVYSPKSTELIDTKGNANQNYVVLTHDSLLYTCFSPQIDALLVASINTNADQNPLQQVKIARFNAASLKADNLLPIIKGDFSPESLQFGKTNEMILYKLNNSVHLYRSNKKTTETLQTDFLFYHQKSDKWMISVANIVSPNTQHSFFETHYSLYGALHGYTETANMFKQSNKRRPSRWTKILPSEKGDYWAMLKNESDEDDGRNIFAIYSKDCKPIAHLSALQNSPLKGYKGTASIAFSPKGNFLLTKSTQGGVKIWFWNIATIKKAMDTFLHVNKS